MNQHVHDAAASVRRSHQANWVCRFITGQFDVWAKRCVHVVWTDTAVDNYDGWLVRYADEWLGAVKSSETLWAFVESLRLRLMGRTEFWKSEARRYLAEQKQHSADIAGQAAKATKRRPLRPKPPCFGPAANLLQDNPQLSLLDFCRRMDSKAEQYPSAAKYLPPKKWKVRSFYDQYKKRSNTVSAFLARVRKELSNTSGS